MGTHKIRPGAEPTTNDTAIAMLRLVLLASLAAAVSAMPQMIYNGQYVYPTVQYAVQPTVQYVQPATVQAAEPKVEYKPTTYVAQPAAEPLFFNNMGFGRYGNGWLGSNNMGGKGMYDEREYKNKYPSYGDYYRTHRYPINDGWMLWDEDLRDLDSKSNKIGSGKDGGR